MNDTHVNASGYPHALLPGTVLGGQYQVERVIGRPGPFGITYLARDVLLDKVVAVAELLPADLARRASDGRTVLPRDAAAAGALRDVRDQFLRDARALAELDHPNVVGVHDIFAEYRTAYVVIDHEPGVSLAEYFERSGGRLPYRHAVDIITLVLDGAAALHARGIVHGDISPHTIRLSTDGRPVLVSFAGTREEGAERDVGALAASRFAPIERYGPADSYGPQTDVYGCAATLYLTITGTLPPDATDRIGEDPLVPPAVLVPNLPAPLNDAIVRGLAVDGRRRPQTAPEFQDLLAADRAPTAGPSDRAPAGFPLALAAAAVIGAVTGAAVQAWRMPDVSAPPAPVVWDSEAPAAARAFRAVHRVRMELVRMQYQFAPAQLTIRAGDVVEFVNVSGGPHNVAFHPAEVPPGVAERLDANMPDRSDAMYKMARLTGPLLVTPNTSYSVSFVGLRPGVYRYHCLPHQALGMAGTIKVVP